MRAVGKFAQAKILLLALGANVPGRWGTPGESLARATRELERAGVHIFRASNVYSTQPLADAPQPRYLNAVLLGETRIAPGALLRLVKRIERDAGRRSVPATGNRPLDVDILDYAGRRSGWPPPRHRERGRLILPHPEMHKRAFVLVPLLEVAPFWRHPASGQKARTLLALLAPSVRAGVRQALDSEACSCDKRLS